MGDDRFRPDLRIFGVSQLDPGYIYIIEDKGRFKIGRSKNSAARLKNARTWLPDMNLIGCKSFWNVSYIERCLHTGFCRSWYHGEWFAFAEENDKDILLEGFTAFSDTDRDWNSVDFIYWFNGEGMAEFIHELYRQRLTLPQFMRQESESKRA